MYCLLATHDLLPSNSHKTRSNNLEMHVAGFLKRGFAKVICGAAVAEKAVAKTAAKRSSRRRSARRKRAGQEHARGWGRQSKDIATATAKITGALCGVASKATGNVSIACSGSIEHVPKILTLRGSSGKSAAIAIGKMSNASLFAASA